MIKFKPIFIKKIYFALLFFALVLPIISVKIINNPLEDPMLTLSAIIILIGMIYILFFRFIRKIEFIDEHRKLIVSYYLIPKKTILYNEIKELSIYSLATSKGNIYFHIMENADQFIKLIEKREKDRFILYTDDSEIKETEKIHSQFKAIKLTILILPFALFSLYLLDFDFGRYAKLIYYTIPFLIGLIIYKLLIRKVT